MYLHEVFDRPRRIARERRQRLREMTASRLSGLGRQSKSKLVRSMTGHSPQKAKRPQKLCTKKNLKTGCQFGSVIALITGAGFIVPAGAGVDYPSATLSAVATFIVFTYLLLPERIREKRAVRVASFPVRAVFKVLGKMFSLLLKGGKKLWHWLDIVCHKIPGFWMVGWLWRAYIKMWTTSVAFWRVFPWVVACTVIFICNFFTLYWLLDIFANDPANIVNWINTLLISFLQGWLVQDMLVIIIRNNIKFTKVIVRTLKYQVIEKFIVGPARAVTDVFRLMIQAAMGMPAY